MNAEELVNALKDKKVPTFGTVMERKNRLKKAMGLAQDDFCLPSSSSQKALLLPTPMLSSRITMTTEATETVTQTITSMPARSAAGRRSGVAASNISVLENIDKMKMAREE